MASIGEIRRGSFAKIETPDVGSIWLPWEDALLTGYDFLETEVEVFGTYGGRGSGWSISLDLADAQEEARSLGAEPEENRS